MNRSKYLKYITLITISFIGFSYIIPLGSSNEVGITDSMFVKHIYRISMLDEDIPSSFTITHSSSETFHVIWSLGGSADATGSWDVNISTSIVLNMQDFGPDNGFHNHAWIWKDVSLNDQLMMFNFFSNTDRLFNITDEAMYGSMAVWQLEDNHGSILWYEKTKGFLVNGTFRHNANWQKYTFVETGTLGTDSGIPGYNLFFLIEMVFLIGIVIFKYKSKKVNKLIKT